jgi:hypothetical protein
MSDFEVSRFQDQPGLNMSEIRTTKSEFERTDFRFEAGEVPREAYSESFTADVSERMFKLGRKKILRRNLARAAVFVVAMAIAIMVLLNLFSDSGFRIELERILGRPAPTDGTSFKSGIVSDEPLPFSDPT